MEKKYLMIESSETVEETTVFDTLEEANSEAFTRWYNSTEQGHRPSLYKNSLTVASVTREDIDEEGIDEETGEIDWRWWRSYEIPDDAWSIEKELAEQESDDDDE